jgi:hypothetical protein
MNESTRACLFSLTQNNIRWSWIPDLRCAVLRDFSIRGLVFLGCVLMYILRYSFGSNSIWTSLCPYLPSLIVHFTIHPQLWLIPQQDVIDLWAFPYQLTSDNCYPWYIWDNRPHCWWPTWRYLDVCFRIQYRVKSNRLCISQFDSTTLR